MKKQTLKKAATVILAVVLAASMAIPAAAGEDGVAKTKKESFSGTYDMSDYSGPEDFRESLLQDIEDTNGDIAAYATKTNGNTQISWSDCDDAYLEILDEVREKMKARENEITVVYHTDEEDIKASKGNTFALRVLYDAMVHNGDPKAGDYLYESTAKTAYSGYVTTREGGGTDITVELTIEWYTTKDEEDQTDAEIDRIISSFGWTGATSDYKKARDIYKYITSTVSYDYEHVNSWFTGDKYYPMRTAYGALIEHSAICHGVAVTVYRLMLEAGIDCRYISGLVSSGSHAWNIVKIGGVYYNCDATWDLGKSSSFKYFLKCEETFSKDHTRYGSYAEDPFYEVYPMSGTDFPSPCETGNHTMVKVSGSPETYKCSECGYTEYTDGVFKGTDGNWYYYKNGKKSTYTGFAENGNGKWYVENGKVTFAKNGVLRDDDGAIGMKTVWYYVVGSKVQTNFTGLSDYKNANGWWYIKKGQVDFTHNGVEKNCNGWFYVTNGRVDFGYTGIADYKNANGWWYIKNGKVDFSADTVAKNKNGWFYVNKGKVNFNFTGLADYNNAYGWWYVKDGRVDFTHNGVDKNKNGWFYVTGGKVNFGYTGVADYKNAYGWWYIKNGAVDFTANGKAKNRYGTWTVSNGKVKF